MAYLIQLADGSEMTVQSLDGHDGCTVLDANAPDVTLATAQTIKRAAVEVYLFQQFLGGFTPSTGPLAGKNLQTRPPPYADRTNWLTAKDIYRDGIAAGNGATATATFRCADNTTVTCSYSDGFSTLQAMADWGDALMKKSWAVKDQIDALTDVASVEAFDIASAWAAA